MFKEIYNFKKAKNYIYKAFKLLENTQHYFRTFAYFVEYLKLKVENEDISSEVCKAIEMLDNIISFHQNTELFAEGIMRIEPIFDKANLDDIHCKERYEKYKKYIEQVRIYKIENNENERIKDDNLDGL